MENRRTQSILERKYTLKKENERLRKELEKFDIEELRIKNHRELMSNGKKAIFYGELPDQYADTIYMQHAPYVEMNITSSLSPESLNYAGFAAGFIRDFSDWGEELTGKVIDTREQTAFTYILHCKNIITDSGEKCLVLTDPFGKIKTVPIKGYKRREIDSWLGKMLRIKMNIDITKKWYEVISVEVVPYPYREVSGSGR